jgi:hypothetical protein
LRSRCSFIAFVNVPVNHIVRTSQQIQIVATKSPIASCQSNSIWFPSRREPGVENLQQPRINDIALLAIVQPVRNPAWPGFNEVLPVKLTASGFEHAEILCSCFRQCFFCYTFSRFAVLKKYATILQTCHL